MTKTNAFSGAKIISLLFFGWALLFLIFQVETEKVILVAVSGDEEHHLKLPLLFFWGFIPNAIFAFLTSFAKNARQLLLWISFIVLSLANGILFQTIYPYLHLKDAVTVSLNELKWVEFYTNAIVLLILVSSLVMAINLYRLKKTN